MAGQSATWATTARWTRQSPSAAPCSKDGQIHVHSGAGIVAGSVPESEFEETEHKAAAMLRGDRDGRSGRCSGHRAGARAGWREVEVILVIDNYDSFTYNLVQALEAARADVLVVRNDELSAEASAQLADRIAGILISPGPGGPADAGISSAAVDLAARA